MINRKIEPEIKETSIIESPEVERVQFDNGTTLHLVNGGSQDIIKIDFIYQAGTYFQHSPVIASMCSAMLNEGTEEYSSKEIAEIFDFHGAYINTSISYHKGIVSLFCLSKDVEKLLDVVEQVIKHSTFPEKEFNTIKANRKSSFIIELEKTSSQARRVFLRSIFGDNHPYANIVTADDFDTLKHQDVIDFYKAQYCPQNCNIVISGNIEESHINAVKERFSDEYCASTHVYKPQHSFRSIDQKKHFIEKKSSVQSSIRMGCLSINKGHEDFYGLEVVNTIFGGYFGSRLMSNIREDKGYTYGISSAIVNLIDTGYFAIATDVGNEVKEATLKEIYKEIDILHNELVSEEELNLVRNYMTGELLRSLDGPFSISDQVNNSLFLDLDDNHYQKNLDVIRNISAEEIQSLARKYIKKEDLFEVVAGA